MTTMTTMTTMEVTRSTGQSSLSQRRLVSLSFVVVASVGNILWTRCPSCTTTGSTLQSITDRNRAGSLEIIARSFHSDGNSTLTTTNSRLTNSTLTNLTIPPPPPPPPQQQQNMNNTTTTHPGVAICTSIYNEGRYLDEWLDYHFAMGFTEVHIHDNSPDSNLLSWNATRFGAVRVYPTPNHTGDLHGNFSSRPDFKLDRWQKAQILACVQMLQAKPIETRPKYVSIFDVDEFLVLRNHMSVGDFLQDTIGDQGGAIQVNRRYFGTDHHVYDLDFPVTLRFRKRLRPADDGTKVLAVLDGIVNAVVHTVEYANKSVPIRTLNGRKLRFVCCAPHPTEPLPAAFHHYYTKSLEEFGRRQWCDSTGCHLLSGRRLFEGRVDDHDAWRFLSRNVPKYERLWTQYKTAVRAKYGSMKNRLELYRRRKEELVGSQSNQTGELVSSQSNQTEDLVGSQSNQTEDLAGSQSNQTEDLAGSQSNQTEELVGSRSNATEELAGSQSNETEE